MKKDYIIMEQFQGNLEIEKKFLVIKKRLPKLINGSVIVQAYIFATEEKEIRIRIADNKCTINIKINLINNIREEFEYEIPLGEGLRLIELGSAYPPIEKIRYVLDYENMKWEIDFFKEGNEGLVIAEIELDYPNQKFVKPYWIKEEVTHDRRYYNANLYWNPYKNWYPI